MVTVSNNCVLYSSYILHCRFEEALRRHDPTVFLPFWDSTIDNDMDNPVNSILWTSQYFGGGTGDVVDGMAAGWVTSQGNLERNYGRRSRLLSKDQIRNILTRCNLRVNNLIY